jgi:nucleoside-diphosphate-sugar epimerase
MRCLITGAQGFVGRYLTAAILDADSCAEVLGIGRSPRDDPFFSHAVTVKGRERRAAVPSWISDRMGSRFRYEQASVANQDQIHAIIEEFQPGYIFHLASGLRDDDEGTLIQTNVRGTSTLMAAIAAAKTPRPVLVLGSTGGVYGAPGQHQISLSELDPCEPVDVYAATKLAAEHIARILGRIHGIPVIVARIFNVVGAGQDERHVCGHLASQLNDSVTRLQVRNLNTTRDFTDVRDVARALMHLAERGEPDSIYNVASGVETRIHQVVDCLLERSGKAGQLKLQAVPCRESDVSRHCADVTRLSALGFRRQHTLDETLADVLAYYRHLE